MLFLHPQSRQSVRLVVRMGPPPPQPKASVPPPPLLVPGGVAHSLAGEGVGWSQSGRGARHCGTLGKYVLCALLEPDEAEHYATLAWSK